ncbi:hypothetical protein M378DRAFT_748118 [Amanita muscaria Koide BX008]|uniref:Uncharacterized protein n=1 Tax=Amanita muscaria (strain Koide BX008) TaxID=946122 RepID=A0A0C2X1X7_AMAMK|nr:hypothetical protein M378DRAFT_748118 [Amanita muscaria Koide BX008]
MELRSLHSSAEIRIAGVVLPEEVPYGYRSRALPPSSLAAVRGKPIFEETRTHTSEVPAQGFQIIDRIFGTDF